MPMRAKAWSLLALTALSAVPAAALAQGAGPGLPLVIGQGAGGTSTNSATASATTPANNAAASAVAAMVPTIGELGKPE